MKKSMKKRLKRRQQQNYCLGCRASLHHIFRIIIPLSTMRFFSKLKASIKMFCGWPLCFHIFLSLWLFCRWCCLHCFFPNTYCTISMLHVPQFSKEQAPSKRNSFGIALGPRHQAIFNLSIHQLIGSGSVEIGGTKSGYQFRLVGHGTLMHPLWNSSNRINTKKITYIQKMNLQ